MKDWIKLLTSNNVTYISNFLLNFIFFDYLHKHGFDWSYCLGKLLKNNQTIKYSWFHSNNYEISSNKIRKMAFTTFAIYSATPKNFWLYKSLHFAAISDKWHCKISHISLLRLYILGKKCLSIRLQDKKIFQYTYCNVSKIF